MPRKKKDYWKNGELKALATLAGMRECHIKEVLKRTRGVSIKKAKKLQEAADFIGKAIPWEAWIDSDRKHKAFTSK